MNIKIAEVAHIRCPRCSKLSHVIIRTYRQNTAVCCGRILRTRRKNYFIHYIIANHRFLKEKINLLKSKSL